MVGRLVPLSQAANKGPGKPETSASKKERLLTCLSKLNDKDTQKRAADELAELLQDKVWLDTETLPMVVSSLCTTGTDQKVHARKEVARALARLVAPSCPQRIAALSAPALNKLIAHFKKVMQDSDSSARELGSAGLAAVSQGLAEVNAPEASHPCSQHPVARVIMECMADGKKELQGAACRALALAAQCCGQVDAPLCKEVFKRLNTPSFQATPGLLQALGHVDTATGMSQGLLLAAPGAFHHHLGALVGQLGSSGQTGGTGAASGLCACLAHKDWQTRKAAADCVRCLVLVMGPLLDTDPSSYSHPTSSGTGTGAGAAGGATEGAGDNRSLSERLSRALEGPKYDKVKEVRETARDAAALLDELIAHGSVAGWSPDMTHTHASPRKRPSSGGAASEAPGASPLSPTRVSSPHSKGGRGASPPHARRSPRPVSPPRQSAIQRNSSVAERFRQAADVRDSVVDLGSRADSRPNTAEDLTAHPDTHTDTHTDTPHPPFTLSDEPSITTAHIPEPPALPIPHRTSASGNTGAVASASGRFLPDIHSSGGGGSAGGSRSGSHDGSGMGLGGVSVSRPVSGRMVRGSGRVSGSGTGAESGAALDATFSARSHGTGSGGSNALPTLTPAALNTPGGNSQQATPRVTQRTNSGTKVPSRPPSGSGAPTPPAPRPTSATRTTAPTAPDTTTAPAPPAPPGHITVPLSDWQALQRQLRDMEARQRELIDQLASQSAKSTRTISELQDRIRVLESHVSNPQHPTTHTTHTAHTIGTSGTISPPRPLSPSAASQPPPPPLPARPPPTNTHPYHPATGAPRRPDPWTLAPLPPHINTGAGAADSAQGPPSPGGGRMAGAGEGQGEAGSQPVSPGAEGAASQQGGPVKASLLDVNAAYREALSAGAASADMQRLLSRTGAAWSALQPDTAHALLDAFTGLLKDPFTLPRVMPWLWRLADEREAPSLQAAGITTQERKRVLTSLQEAITAWQQANHPEMAAKLQLLHQTLQSHWATHTPQPPPQQPTSPRGQSTHTHAPAYASPLPPAHPRPMSAQPHAASTQPAAGAGSQHASLALPASSWGPAATPPRPKTAGAVPADAAGVITPSQAAAAPAGTTLGAGSKQQSPAGVASARPPLPAAAAAQPAAPAAAAGTEGSSSREETTAPVGDRQRSISPVQSRTISATTAAESQRSPATLPTAANTTSPPPPPSQPQAQAPLPAQPATGSSTAPEQEGVTSAPSDANPTLTPFQTAAQDSISPSTSVTAQVTSAADTVPATHTQVTALAKSPPGVGKGASTAVAVDVSTGGSADTHLGAGADASVAHGVGGDNQGESPVRSSGGAVSGGGVEALKATFGSGVLPRAADIDTTTGSGGMSNTPADMGGDMVESQGAQEPASGPASTAGAAAAAAADTAAPALLAAAPGEARQAPDSAPVSDAAGAVSAAAPAVASSAAPAAAVTPAAAAASDASPASTHTATSIPRTHTASVRSAGDATPSQSGGGPSGPTPGRTGSGINNKLLSDLDALERDYMQSPAFMKARMLTEAAKERAASVSPPLSSELVCLPPSKLSGSAATVEPPAAAGGGAGASGAETTGDADTVKVTDVE